MVSAVKMTPEQIDELVETAQRDPALWNEIKDREVNQFYSDGSPKLPSLAMLVEDLVKSKYGQDHNYYVGSLIIEIRCHARQELGLQA